jgi:Transglycosylase SLT domain
VGAVAQPLPRRRLIPVAALVGALLCVLPIALVAGMMGGLAQSSCAPAATADFAPSRAALDDIPGNYLRWMRQASNRYRVHWSVLAGIYSIESNFGRLQAPGVRMGENYAGAGGPGQFLAATWALYAVDGDGDGDKDRYNPADAILSSANLLRQSGAPGDYRRAIFAYNHANWYVNDVLSRAARYRAAAARDSDALQAPLPPDASESAACTQLAASGGPTDFDRALRLTAPTAYRPLPAWAMATGRPPQPVDARIYGDAVWLLRRYNLRVTAAREPGHHTHGDGTALDLVPATAAAQSDWDRSAGRLARDLGWTPGCGESGTRPAGPPARSSRQSGSLATTASRATARRAPARASAQPTSTSPGSRPATGQAGSSHRASG